jgi:hypothetical protein
VDESDPQLTGHVGGGQDAYDTRYCCSGGRVDADDVGAGVRGEVQRGVDHAVDAQVVDVVLLPHREVEPLIPRAAGADATERDGLRRLALGQELDRVEDLDVTGAAAQVRAEVPGRGGSVEARPLLLEERRGAHQDPGCAESALQGAGGGERGGHAAALALVDPFERRDLGAFHPFQREVAAHDRLPVDQDRAAPTLTGRRTAVLRRQHAQLLAQCGEEMRVLVGDTHRCAVEDELGHETRFTGLQHFVNARPVAIV